MLFYSYHLLPSLENFAVPSDLLFEILIPSRQTSNVELLIQAEELAAALKATNGGGNTAQKDINDGVRRFIICNVINEVYRFNVP